LLDLIRKEVDRTNCELLATCIFFNDRMSDYHAAADFLKNKFCLGNNSGFARYLFFRTLGREKVPRDLLPNDNDLGNRLIPNVRR